MKLLFHVCSHQGVGFTSGTDDTRSEGAITSLLDRDPDRQEMSWQSKRRSEYNVTTTIILIVGALFGLSVSSFLGIIWWGKKQSGEEKKKSGTW